MKTMLESFYARPLAVYLVVALIVMSSFAASAEAMFVPAAHSQDTAAVPHAAFDRAADLARVQAALESKVVSQKLMDYGLSPSETMARVHALSDQQLHELAAHTDSVQAGGDVVGFFVGVVIVALLVVVLVYLLQGRIVVK
jgi:hypothetical protein